MKIRKVTGIPLIAATLLSCSFSVLAQTAPAGGPPKVLQIYREEVKPGKAPAHEGVEAGWPRAFAKANWPSHYLAMTALTKHGVNRVLPVVLSYAAAVTFGGGGGRLSRHRER